MMSQYQEPKELKLTNKYIIFFFFPTLWEKIVLFKKYLSNLFIANLLVILYACIEVTYFDYYSTVGEQNHFINTTDQEAFTSYQC